tara:strand:+ start:5466 stop:5831 length:366 start_codon:yes stop_codon:yes gene_type:complete
MDFTLWAIHNNGQMEPVDLQKLRAEILHDEQCESQWAALLAGLCYRLDGSADPQVEDAMQWVRNQMDRSADAPAPITSQAAAPAEPEPPKPDPPKAVLVTFGLCAILGAYTVVDWLWSLVY